MGRFVRYLDRRVLLHVPMKQYVREHREQECYLSGRKRDGTETRTQLVLMPAIETGISWRYVKNGESRSRRPCIPRPEPVGGQDAHVP